MKKLSPAIFVGLLFVLCSLAHADGKHVLYTDEQLKNIWRGIKDQCAGLAKSEAKPDLYDKCITYQKGEWKAWYDLYADPSVSQMVWERCDYETGFRQTLDLHTYNQCLRLAKDRPDLK
ncbi:hypothetical protein [Dyella japonica]|uniref:DUF1311 domain-containing protein n=1 Tax=Dyella japonica TaxID=231455 RepID=A0ABV2K211_9GAMM